MAKKGTGAAIAVGIGALALAGLAVAASSGGGKAIDMEVVLEEEHNGCKIRVTRNELLGQVAFIGWRWDTGKNNWVVAGQAVWSKEEARDIARSQCLAPAPEPAPAPAPEPAPAPAPEPAPAPAPAPGAVDLFTNWGNVPMEWRTVFAKAEEASGIPDMAKHLAITAWGAGKGKFCRKCHNKNDIWASEKAIIKRTEPKPEGYGWLWDAPKYKEQYMTHGSIGFLDLLVGVQVYAGANENFWPLLPYEVDVFYRDDVQLYVGSWITYRAIHAWPVKHWPDIRVIHALPSALKAEDQTYANSVREKYTGRAAELEIDLDKMASPNASAWPGAKAVWQRLGVLQA